MHRLCLLCLLFSITSVLAGADDRATPAQQATLQLKDKSRIVGSIVGAADGAFKVQTESLGTVTVRQQDIARIDYHTPKAPAKAATPTAANAAMAKPPEPNGLLGKMFSMEAMTQKILSNPDMTMALQKLADDPEIQDIMNDEALMKDIENGNYLKLLNNQKLRSLMENNTIQSISNQLLNREEAETKPANNDGAKQ